MSRRGENIRKRKDGRWEGRYIKGYFKICVRVSHQGSYAFVSAMDFGTSKQMKKAGQAEAYRADRKGKSMSYKVGSMIGQGLTSIGRSKSKLEEEQNYYACIIDIFDEIVS